MTASHYLDWSPQDPDSTSSYLLASEPPTAAVFELPGIESKHPLAARPDDLYGNNTKAAQKASTNVIRPGTNGRHMHTPPHVLPFDAMFSSTVLEMDGLAFFCRCHADHIDRQTNRESTLPPLVTRRIGQAIQRNRPAFRHKDEWSCAIHAECRFLSRGRGRPRRPGGLMTALHVLGISVKCILL